MAARCRAMDWSATPLGPVEGWPAALRSGVRVRECGSAKVRKCESAKVRKCESAKVREWLRTRVVVR
jgi:hypothetical protein